MPNFIRGFYDVIKRPNFGVLVLPYKRMPQIHAARLLFILKLSYKLSIFYVICFGFYDVIILAWALGLYG